MPKFAGDVGVGEAIESTALHEALGAVKNRRPGIDLLGRAPDRHAHLSPGPAA